MSFNVNLDRIDTNDNFDVKPNLSIVSLNRFSPNINRIRRYLGKDIDRC
jgi:hypothetical protein